MDPRLDPDVQALQAGRAETKPARMRDVGHQHFRDWLESVPHPADLPRMHAHRSLTIPGPGGPVPLDVYTRRPGNNLPVIVYFHGGGMVMGSNHSFRPTALHLAAASGATVVAVDYRLAPEHQVPAQLEDCYAATSWVAEHAADLGVDADRIAVVGDSAGGTLAAGVALMARDQGGPALCCQVLVYPGVDTDMEAPSIREFPDAPGLTADDILYLRELAGDTLGATSPYVVPMLADDLSGLPQAVVAVAEIDPIRDWGERYAARLTEARVQTTLTRYPGVNHGFFMHASLVRRAALAMAETGALLAAKFDNPVRW